MSCNPASWLTPPGSGSAPYIFCSVACAEVFLQDLHTCTAKRCRSFYPLYAVAANVLLVVASVGRIVTRATCVAAICFHTLGSRLQRKKWYCLRLGLGLRNLLSNVMEATVKSIRSTLKDKVIYCNHHGVLFSQEVVFSLSASRDTDNGTVKKRRNPRHTSKPGSIREKADSQFIFWIRARVS